MVSDETIVSLFEKHLSLTPIKVIRPSKRTVSAELNSIYYISLPSIPMTRNDLTTTEFVLRLSKSVHPQIKTQNEVGWLTFLETQKTFSKIRAPKVLFWSDSIEEIGSEYTVIEKLPGLTLSDIWETVQPQLIVSQVIDIVLELRYLTSKLSEEKWFGGISADGNSPGPFVEITSYTNEDIEHYWPSSIYPLESYKTLNLISSFKSWKEYLLARLERDIYVIEKHNSCINLRESFLLQLRQIVKSSKNIEFNVQGFIAHRDLHFANLLWSLENNSISAVLDWELAGIYPLSHWNPGNTLWTVKIPTNSSSTTQEEFFQLLNGELNKRSDHLTETKEEEENSTEYHYERIVSLTFWIVRKYVQGLSEETKVKQWIKQWKEHIQLFNTSLQTEIIT